MLFALLPAGLFKYSETAVGTPSVNKTIELSRVSTPWLTGSARSLMCAFCSSIYAIESASALPVPLFAVTAAIWCGMSLVVPSLKVLFGPPVDAMLIVEGQAPVGEPTTALPSYTTDRQMV